jgi:hypothetical protein
MVAVFVVLWVGVTIQEGSPDPPGKDWVEQLGYQIGATLPFVIVDVILVAGLPLLLGGVYYATTRKDGVTFREAVFNWPLVIIAAIFTFLLLL